MNPTPYTVCVCGGAGYRPCDQTTQMSTFSSGSTYAVVIYGSSILSLLTNSTLMAFYMRCPLRTIEIYKHFFAVTALHDITISVIMMLCVPRAYHGAYYYITVPTGLIQHCRAGVALLMLFWFALYSSFLILANSFVYRYIYVCRSKLSYLYTSKMWILIICTVNALLLSNSVVLLFMTAIPNEELRTQVNSELTEMNARAYTGVSLVHTKDKSSISLTLAFTPLMLCLLVTFFCAIRIHLTVKQSGLNSNVKRVHRQMYRVLLFQTTCPMMFVYAPSIVVYVILFGNIDTVPLVTDCVGVLFSLYPLFNSIVTAFSVKDYRRYLISLISDRIASVRSIAQSLAL